MAMSWYVIEDKNKADLIIANAEDSEPIVTSEEVEGQEDDWFFTHKNDF